MQPRQSLQMSLALRCQSNLDPTAVLCAYFTLDQPELLATRHERNGSMMVGLKSLRELADGGPLTSWVSLDVQHQQVLQRSHAFATHDFFAKAQKTTHLIAEIGQRFEI